MAPKKKGSKSSKGTRGSGGVIDGVSMAEMTREQLEGFTLRIRDELEREREERNYFQLERDKLRTFWEITWQQHEENRAELRNKDRALEEAEEGHQSFIKVYKEKVKHLLYEHQNNLTNLKAEKMVALKLAEEDYMGQESLLLEDKEGLKNQLIDAESAQEEFIRELHMKQSEELYKMREDFARKLVEISSSSDDRMDEMREYFTLMNKTELQELEERKNAEFAETVAAHEDRFKELKDFYNDVTINNLSLISCLKEELLNLKSKNENQAKIVKKLSSENAKLKEPLDEATKRVQELEKQLSRYNKDKESLMNFHKRLRLANDEIDALTLERDELQTNSEKLENELVEMKDHYTGLVFEIQKNAGMKRTMLEKKIDFLEEELEDREVQLAHVVSKANLDPKSVINANEKIERIREARERKVHELQVELGRAVKHHDELLDLLYRKSEERGFALDEEEASLEYLRPRLRALAMSLSQTSLSEQYRDTL